MYRAQQYEGQVLRQDAGLQAGEHPIAGIGGGGMKTGGGGGIIIIIGGGGGGGKVAWQQDGVHAGVQACVHGEGQVRVNVGGGAGGGGTGGPG